MKKALIILLVLPLLSGCFSYMATKSVSKGDIPKMKHYVEDKNVSPDRLFPKAVKLCRTEEAKYLLDKGASVKVRDSWDNKGENVFQRFDFTRGANRPFSPLISAIENKCYEIVEMLVAKGADVNAPLDKRGLSPLLMAAQTNSPKIIDLLVKNGANVNRGSGDNITPLLIACEFSNFEAVNALLEHGANTEAVYGKLTPLAVAVFKGNLSIVNALLEKHANVNAVCYGAEYVAGNGKKSTIDVPAVKYAFDAGRMEIFDALLQAGADINAVSSDGLSALSAAITGNGDIKKTRQLLFKGANPNIPYRGFQLLSVAADQSNYEAVKALLDANADTEIRDRQGYLPVDYSKTVEIKSLIQSYSDAKYEKAAKSVATDNFEVKVNARRYDNNNVKVTLWLKNISPKVIEFGPMSVAASGGDGATMILKKPSEIIQAKYGRGQAEYADLLRDYKDNEWKAQMAFLSAMQQGQSANRVYNVTGSSRKIGNTSYGTYTATPSPAGGFVTGFAQGLATMNALNAQNEAVDNQAEIRAQMAMARNIGIEAANLSKDLLIPTNIPPGGTFSGVVYFSSPRDGQLKIYLSDDPAKSIELAL